MTLPNAQRMDAARRRIEDALCEMDRQISNLHTKRKKLLESLNAHTFPSTLPSELLAHVFLQYVIEAHQPDSSISYTSWIRVAHVCRLWRLVALETPRLWSYIYVTDKPEWTRMMLTHAKQVPIAIWAHRMCSNREHATAEAIRCLTVCSMDFRLYNVQLANSPLRSMHSFPSLRSLRVSYENWVPSRVPVALPLPISIADAPLLAHLEYHGPRFSSLDSLVYPTLTSLALFDTSQSKRGLVPIRNLIIGLRSMPLLEELILSYVFPHANSSLASTTDTSPVSLPRLRKLTLMVSRLTPTISFLNLIAPPAEAVIIRVESTRIKPSDHALVPLLSHAIANVTRLLPFSGGTSGRRQLRSVAVLNSDSVHINVQGWTCTQSLTRDAPDSNTESPTIFLTLALARNHPKDPTWLHRMRSTLESFFGTFPLSGAKTFHLGQINYCKHFPFSIWSRVASAMPNLRAIKTDRTTSSRLLKILSSRLFPKLHTLVLNTVPFQEVLVREVDVDYKTLSIVELGGGTFFNCLRSCLRIRKESRSGKSNIQKLVLLGCKQLHVGDIQQLGSYVDVVQWLSVDGDNTERCSHTQELAT